MRITRLGRAGLLLVVLLSWSSAVAAGPAAWLVLTTDEPQRVVACLPLNAGEPFYLEFINSIYLAPVRESYVFEPPEGLFTILVESPHAGVFDYLGLIPDEPGKARLRRKLGDIRLLSSDYQNHRLTVGGTVLRLKGLVPDGRPIILRILTDRGCEP